MNPYQSPLTHIAPGKEAGGNAGWLFHVAGAAFLLLAIFSWFLIADYMRPAMQKSESSYQLLGLLFVLAFFAFLPFSVYCFYYVRNISDLSTVGKLLFGIYVLPLLCSWATAIFIHR